jgi:hypothetical protein
MKPIYTLNGQIPTLLEFIQGERPDVSEVIEVYGGYEFKGKMVRVEIEDPVTGMMIETWEELPLENVEEIYALLPLYGPLVARMTVFQKVRSDALFGEQLATEFAVENILSGITNDPKASVVRKATAGIESALRSGFLNEAISEIEKISVSDKDLKFLSEERLQKFKKRIEDRLKD